MNKLTKPLKLLLFILLIFAVLILVTSRTSALFGIRSMVVLSGSMQPSIPVGSIVFVQKSENYNVGEVIAFQNKAKQTVTHRIVEKTGEGEEVFYQTKGDANNTPDSDLVSESQVLGRKIFMVPVIGRFVSFLRTLPGFLGLIIIPSLVFIGFEVFNIKKEMEKEVRKKLMKEMKSRPMSS